ncbi:sugar O-acetyltransferase [Limosilactobacillus kribbianus]|uniref:sugar O-acetyltransferase n=1 Tax=Limosilactobacillus kribbianus TaxID=2982695 RepID=UPI0022642B28|nr:sugar O-acetyltransferase [Limosilactobacillus kribbianus]
MTENFDEMLFSGKIYNPENPALLKEQGEAARLMYEYNATRADQGEQRAALLPKLLAECGESCYIEAPFYANWGGHHVHFGDHVYANFHLTLVDDGEIFVGSHTMFGPNVTLVTAAHPVLPELREKGYQYNLPVHIGQNCWFGANVTVLPGVTIGDNSVIGAGSVVTKDIPANVVAVDTPCRVMREIGERDRQYYRGMQIDPALLKKVEKE